MICISISENTSTIIDFQIEAHPGSKVQYQWDFGGQDALNTTVRNAAYAFTSPGIYTVHMLAYNDISNDSYSVSGSS